MNLERVAQLHMPVDSTALAQVLYPVLQPPWPPPLPQLAQKPPKCPPRSPRTPSSHLFCQHPSSLTTVAGFPAEGTFSSVSSLPPLLPTENIYSSGQRGRGPAWGCKAAVEHPTPRATRQLTTPAPACQSQLGRRTGIYPQPSPRHPSRCPQQHCPQLQATVFGDLSKGW